MGPDEGEAGVPKKGTGRIIRSDEKSPAEASGLGEKTREPQEWASTAGGPKISKNVDELEKWDGFNTGHAKGAATPGEVVEGWDTSEVDAEWEATKKPKWVDQPHGEKKSEGSGAEWTTDEPAAEWQTEQSAGRPKEPVAEWKQEESVAEWKADPAPSTEEPAPEWESDEPKAEWQTGKEGSESEWDRIKKEKKAKSDDVEWGS